MTTPTDENDRLLRRIPWATVVAIAVGGGWYGVTRLVGVPFDRSAVVFVACAFLLALVAPTSIPPPPARSDAGEAVPAVAPENVVLPHERNPPVLYRFVMSSLRGALAAFLLGLAVWLLATRPGEADGAAVSLVLLGLFFVALFALDWADMRRILHVRWLERRRSRRNMEK